MLDEDAIQCFGLATRKSPEFPAECVIGKVKEIQRCEKNGLKKID